MQNLIPKDLTSLTLARNLGETIHIGDDVALKITEIYAGRVKINITAPREMKILRGEMISERKT